VELHKVKRGTPFERELGYRILVERVLQDGKIFKLEEVFYKGGGKVEYVGGTVFGHLNVFIRVFFFFK